MSIEPVNLPDAAGINYAEHDVRHLTQGDELSDVSISAATRNLADRDSALMVGLNLVIAAVNNKEQLVQVPTICCMLPPQASVIMANYRIPPGFESRVLNATVAATPANQACRLDISYGTGYGAKTGVNVVSTFGEAPLDLKFFGTGEFIITLVNTGGATLDATASILLTFRPTSDQSGAVLGPGTQGEQGIPGLPGEPGAAGVAGLTGPQGSPGLVMTGPYNALTAYGPRDIATIYQSGTGTSAWVSNATQTGVAPPAGPWTVLVKPDAPLQGIPGTPGAAGAAGASAAPIFFTRSVDGTIYTQADYVVSTAEAGYVVVTAGTHILPMTESSVVGANNMGMAFLKSQNLLKFKGTLSVKLPSQFYGATVDFTTPDTIFSAVAHGTDRNATPLVQVSVVLPNTIHITAQYPDTKVSFDLAAFKTF
jgi:hypothetical protein